MATQDFYASLTPLTHWLELANLSAYVDAPDDWYVLISDIVESTQAIAQGRYKEVTLLGASSIMAVLNAVKPLDIPFVFGGDGASLLVPPAYLQSARDALLGVRRLAHQSFGLDMRVGVVPVPVVKAKCSLKVAKLRLTPRYCQANFIGGGISYANDLVKTQAAYRLDVAVPLRKADLSGLECRWQDLPSRHGQMLSLIVTRLSNGPYSDERIYREVLKEIQRIYGNAENYRPVSHSALKLSFNPRHLSAEIKARSPSPTRQGQTRYLLGILAENFLGALFMNVRLTAGQVDWGRYKDDVCAASDYQKIDDLLRMVISSRSSQTERLHRYLEERFRAGHLAYGLHVSDRALMTCLILDRRDRHFHLIDGADGGYAVAAKALKHRLHQAQNWSTDSALSAIAQSLPQSSP